jgi:hypothetical protein
MTMDNVGRGSASPMTAAPSSIKRELFNYPQAIQSMNHYLQLVPDASAAQEKIYDWERKAGEGN